MYELAVLLAGKVTPAKKKAAVEMISKIVSVNGGKITKTDDWGERELAYKIKGEESGHYIIFTLEMSAGAAANLNDKLRIEESVARYLLLKK